MLSCSQAFQQARECAKETTVAERVGLRVAAATPAQTVASHA
jgi:hypothetical protein